MTRIAPNLVWHPRLAEGCDRLNARAKAENEASERASAVERARKIIRNPRGVSDKNLRTACMWFMAHGDGGPDYLLADQRLFEITKREQIARNRAQAAALQSSFDADREEAARLALARKNLGLFAVLYMMVFALIVAAVGLGWSPW